MHRVVTAGGRQTSVERHGSKGVSRRSFGAVIGGGREEDGTNRTIVAFGLDHSRSCHRRQSNLANQRPGHKGRWP